MAVNLDYQGFEEELATLPGRYAPPNGCLLLALSGAGSPLGCIGLRPLEQAGVCEMKRLFVAPAARDFGLGRDLALRLVSDAARLGYKKIRLDTLDSMAEATRLYERLGFLRIPSYYMPAPLAPSSWS